ncbi:hypothetical protein [Pantoea dispersa]
MDNPILLQRLKKHRQYRQIIDYYQQTKSKSAVQRMFMLSEEEAALVCGIINYLVGNENTYDN